MPHWGSFKNSWRKHRQSIENMLMDIERDVFQDPAFHQESDDDILITGYTPGVVNIDSDDEDELGEVFGTIRANIVGIRYYKGTVSNNEMVSLHREPHNSYDLNAIRVDNMVGQQVGHIKREAAAALSAVIDRGLCRVEGTVPFGSNNTYSMPINLTLWGSPGKKDEAVGILKQRGLAVNPLSDPVKKKSGKTKSEKGLSDVERAQFNRLNEFLNPRRTLLSQEEIRNELDQLFENLQEGDKTTPKLPAQALKSPLYIHQQQALNWMVSKERGHDLPPFWQERGPNDYFNSLTLFATPKRPKSICGGILADDMGLGKTLDVIALILTNFVDGEPLALPVGMVQTVPALPGNSQRKADNSIHASKASAGVSKVGARKKAGSKIKRESHQVPLIVTHDDEDVDNSMSDLPADPEYRCVAVESGVADEGTRRSRRNVKRPVYFDDFDDDDVINVETMPKKAKVEKKATFKGKGRGKSSKKTAPDQIRISHDDVLQPIINDVRIPSIPECTQPIKSEVAESDEAGQTVKSENETTLESIEPINKANGGAPDLHSCPQEVQDTDVICLDELPDIPVLPIKTSVSTPEPPDSRGVYYPPCGIDGTGRTATCGPRATLIVCPLSVLSNWLDQLDEHLHDCVNLNIHTFYGPQRTKDPNLLSQQDIVVTTYATLTCDAKGEGVLKRVEWLRVVLDEGHIIRNPNAQQTKAIMEIRAHRRWVLTGTPIQNSLRDLWTLVKFLGIEPLTDRTWWNRTIQRPVMAGDASALKRVQMLMGNIAMRRTKTQSVDGKRLIELPERRIYIEHVVLSNEERSLYEEMEKHGRITISRYFNQGTLLHHYGEVLAILMRLRQLCCHPKLVAKAVAKAIEEGARVADGDGSNSSSSDPVDRKKLVESLLAVLNSGADEDCAICLDALNLPVITPCAHVYCRMCIEAVIRNEKPSPKCPLCRGYISRKELVEVPPETVETADTLDVGTENGQEWKSSTKVDALMKCLIRLREEQPTVKSLVVSQFTSLLALLQVPLRHYGFSFTCLDGSMNLTERSRSITAFSRTTPDAPTIFLLSLKAGGVGINLTAASHVFLLDPAWNPATEDQCFDRCHRLGQTRDVVITKFVVDDSVETKMLELQERKRQLMQGAFAKKMTGEERRQMRINDITSLIDIRRPDT